MQFFDENPELTALCRQIASILTKDRLTQVGLDRLNNLPSSTSSGPIIAPTQAILTTALSLGMSVTLAGGVDKVKGWSIEEIETSSLEVRRKGVKEHERRAVAMGLCPPDTKNAGMLYTLGKARQHWPGWFDLLSSQRTKLVLQILAKAQETWREAGRAGMQRHPGVATHASHVVRTASARSWRQVMYERLFVLTRHPTKYEHDVEEWFDGVHSELEKMQSPVQRGQALQKLGLLKLVDFKDFNRLFKKSPG